MVYVGQIDIQKYYKNLRGSSFLSLFFHFSKMQSVNSLNVVLFKLLTVLFINFRILHVNINGI